MVDELFWRGLKIGDWATWAAAFGSAGAAVAAWYAARTAIQVASIPIHEQERAREVTCRSLAPAIGPELRRALEDAHALAEKLSDVVNLKTGQQLISWLEDGFLLNTTMLERSLEKFDMFGSDDGAKLSAATAAILNLRARVNHWLKDGGGQAAVQPGASFQMRDIVRLRPVEAEARMVVNLIQSLDSILVKYGGGKTQWEI